MVRFKNRYLVLEVNPTRSSHEEKLDLKPYSLQQAILEQLQLLHGDFGVAAVRSGFTTKYCNEYTRVAFIRVRHGPHKLLTSTIPLVTKVHKTPVVLKSLYTGASLMQCNKFLKSHQEKQLKKIWASLKTEQEKTLMKELYSQIKPYSASKKKN